MMRRSPLWRLCERKKHSAPDRLRLVICEVAMAGAGNVVAVFLVS